MINLTKLVIKSLLKQVGIVYQVIQGFLIYLVSRKPDILILKPIKSAKKIAIFAAYRKHYDASLDLTLGELKKRGFSIVFVSNCSLSKDFVRQLKNKADIVIERGNYGRCIAAYKAGFLFLHANKFYGADHILFLNDTMIFPLFNADKFWKDMDTCDADIAGVYESNEISYHIQSFFIYCKNHIFLEKNFINFWIKYNAFNSKQLIIKYGELGFSKMCLGAGFKLYSFVNGLKVNKRFDKIAKIDKNFLPFHIRNDSISIIDIINSKHNTSHSFGLIAPFFFNLPLMKTDLISAGSFTKTQISSTLKKIIRSDLLPIVLNELNKKKPIRSAGLLHRLKLYSGMI